MHLTKASHESPTFPKPTSRLAQRTARLREDQRAEQAFKRAVWDRDEGKCRVCSVRCLRVLTLHPRRGEVHHLEGRHRLTRYEPRCAILVCAVCHERLTHHRIRVWAGRRWFTEEGTSLIDADAPLTFEVMP